MLLSRKNIYQSIFSFFLVTAFCVYLVERQLQKKNLVSPASLDPVDVEEESLPAFNFPESALPFEEKNIVQPTLTESDTAALPLPPTKIENGEESFDPYPWPKRIDIRHVIGEQEKKCYPFATNYTSLDVFFAPDYRPGSMMPFIDLRGHRFDNNTYAANLGIGGRSIPDYCSRFCEMLGWNIYYDYRQGNIGYYQQVGVGIEVLKRRWDFRANAYVPFGAKRHSHVCSFVDFDYYAIRKDIESVSYSFNGEVGWLMVNSEQFLLYFAGGPYFLVRNKSKDAIPGAEIRLRPQYKDYIALDLSWRYDRLFQTIWQAEIIFTLPLYHLADKNRCPCGLTDRQIYQPVERFEVMPLSKRSCWNTNLE